MKDSNMLCPFCDVSPTMSDFVRDREMDFEGVPTIVHGLLLSKCGSCGMETITPSQSRVNKRTIIEAHKSALGLLTAAEIVQLRKQLGITQIEAAQLFGGGTNAFSKYENSAVTQSKAMDTLLRLARDVPAAAEYLAIREKITIGNIAVKDYIKFSIATEIGLRLGTSGQLIDDELTGTGNIYDHSAQLTQYKPRSYFSGGRSKNASLHTAAEQQIVNYSLLKGLQ